MFFVSLPILILILNSERDELIIMENLGNLIKSCSEGKIEDRFYFYESGIIVKASVNHIKK